MANKHLSTVSEFIGVNLLSPNDPLPILIAENVRVETFKFQDFASDAGILFTSFSEDADCIGIDTSTIRFLQLCSGDSWGVEA